ncbi:MAG: ABC transporter permease [Planctomycetota bacterium]
MLSYILRRLLLMVPTLLGVTLVVFFVMAMAPGGFGAALEQTGDQTVGEEAKQQKAYMMRRYGLDRPLVVQYGRWLNQVSPLGFRTSSEAIDPEDKEAHDAANAEAAEPVAEAHAWLNEGQRGQIGAAIRSIASYEQRPVADVADEVSEALADPKGAGVSLFDRISRTEEDRDLATKSMVEAETVEEARIELVRSLRYEAGGLDRILFTRPAAWPLKSPDLGRTIREEKVSDKIMQALPITLLLNLITFPLIYIVAILIGIYAARHRGGAFDIASGSVLLGFWSFPRIGAGVLLIAMLASNQRLNWFPTGGLNKLEADAMPFLPTMAGFSHSAGFAAHVLICALIPLGVLLLIGLLIGYGPKLLQGKRPPKGTGLVTLGIIGLILIGWLEFRFKLFPDYMPESRGWLLDRIWHLVLPVLCLIYTGFALLSKLMRGSVLDNLSSDFVRTARAKGVSDRDVLFRHVFRNSLLPLITVAAAIIPAMIVGSVVVERIFTIQGMGFLAVEAAFQKDRELILATTLFAGLLGLASELIRDICYAVADPRVSFE